MESGYGLRREADDKLRKIMLLYSSCLWRPPHMKLVIMSQLESMVCLLNIGHNEETFPYDKTQITKVIENADKVILLLEEYIQEYSDRANLVGKQFLESSMLPLP